MWLVLFSFKQTFPKHLAISIQHVVHLINIINSPLLKNNSLFHLLYDKAPTLLHLKSFSCLAYASTILANRTKFDTRTRKTIFLSFRNGAKGYLLSDLLSHEFFIYRNSIFYEIYFPFNTTNNPTNPSLNPTLHTNEPDLEPLPHFRPIELHIPLSPNPPPPLPLLLTPPILPHL